MIRKNGHREPMTLRSSNTSMRDQAALTSAFESKELTKKQLFDIYKLFEEDYVLGKMEDDPCKEILALTTKIGNNTLISVGSTINKDFLIARGRDDVV